MQRPRLPQPSDSRPARRCGCLFAFLFALTALAFAVQTGDWSVFRVSDTPSECALLVWPFSNGLRSGHLTHAQLLALVGILNALNEVFVIYASPPERTPPLISSILQNSNVLFSVPFAKWVLRDRKTYVDKEPLLAATLIVGSVFVSLGPTFTELLKGNDTPKGLSTDAATESGGSIIAWALVYICGLIPQSLFNTLQQLYFLRIDPMGDADVSWHEETRTFIRALLAAQTAQMCTYPFLFWVDLIPNFGCSAQGSSCNSSSVGGIGTWWNNTRASLACSLGVFTQDATCKSSIPWFAWGFVLSNITGYYACALVNKESATFNMLCMVLVTSCTSLIWEIPGAEPAIASGTTRLWSVLLSLVLCFVGSGVWKAWEARTPTTEQFAICATLQERLVWERLQCAVEEEQAPAEEDSEEGGKGGLITRAQALFSAARGHSSLEGATTPLLQGEDSKTLDEAAGEQ